MKKRADHYFTGKIDEVRVSSEFLSDKEVIARWLKMSLERASKSR